MDDLANSRAIFRSIIERGDIEQFADSVLATFVERPEFQSLRPPDDVLRAWVRWNIDLVLQWLLEGQQPSERELDAFRELARAAAADGTAMDVVLGNYRKAARYAWNSLQAAASEEERGALSAGAGLLFEFVDLVSDAFAEAYEEATRQGGIASEERAAQQLFERLLNSAGLDADDHHIADRTRFDLTRDPQPIVMAATGRPVRHYAAAAQRLRARGVLAVSRGRVVSGLAHDLGDWQGLGVDLGADTVFARGAAAPAGELAPVFDDLRLLVEIAIARGRVGEVHMREHLPELLLHRSPALATQLHQRVYGNLSPDLAHTLGTLIEHGFDRAATGAALPVHRNTLTNRIHRINEAAELDLDSADGLTLAWLAWLQQTNPVVGVDRQS